MIARLSIGSLRTGTKFLGVWEYILVSKQNVTRLWSDTLKKFCLWKRCKINAWQIYHRCGGLKQQHMTMLLIISLTCMQNMFWFCNSIKERVRTNTWTFCTKLYVNDHRENILKEIESHLVPKLKLQVRMWSRRLSLVTVATEILRFLSMTVVTTQSFDHSFFDQRIPSWSWPHITLRCLLFFHLRYSIFNFLIITRLVCAWLTVMYIVVTEWSLRKLK